MKLTISELIVKTLAAAGVNPTCCGQPELSVAGLLVPWITIVGALGFLAAWVVAAILERTGLSRHVWHLPLFFLALVVLFKLAHRHRVLPMKTKLFNYLITLTLVGLAAWAAASLYYRYLENPWTRDGQVRANVVGIAPRVSGPIIRVAVRDNESVHQGDLLFEIDPADFQAQVDLAAGQVQTAEANLKQLSQNLQRQTELYRTRVNALQDFQNAQDSFEAARAQLASAKANLELARLNLSYTKVLAPVEGDVTNMNTSPGTYVTAGNQLMALVDISSFWVAGYFKETQLPHIQFGQKARISLMGHADQPFEGVVRSLGWGIFVSDGSGSNSTALLPAVDQTIDWVRLPQRFPVRIQVIGPTPMPLRIGQTVSVAMTSEVEPLRAPNQPSLAGPR